MRDDFEKRRYPRLTPLDSRAWLAWWDEPGVAWSHVRLLDISPSGAGVGLPRAPVPGAPVMLSLRGEAAPAAIEAEVVAVSRKADRSYVARLEFLEPCPPEFLSAACDRPT